MLSGAGLLLSSTLKFRALMVAISLHSIISERRGWQLMLVDRLHPWSCFLHWSLILEIGFWGTFLDNLAALLNAVYLHIVEVIMAEDDGPLTPFIHRFLLASDRQKRFQALSGSCIWVLGIDDGWQVKVTLQCKALSSDTILQATVGHFFGVIMQRKKICRAILAPLLLKTYSRYRLLFFNTAYTYIHVKIAC
jgi:hypothetical protein